MRKYKTWVGELVPSPDETGIDGSTVDVYLASEVDARPLETVIEAQRQKIQELERYEKAVREHNEECERFCAGASKCGYKQYFDGNGRRCPTCPVYSKVEVE